MFSQDKGGIDTAKARLDPATNKFFLDWYEGESRRRLITGTDEKHAQRELEKLKARLLMKKMGFAESAPATSQEPKPKLPTLSVELAIQKYLEYSQTHHSPMNYQHNDYVLNGPFLSFLKRKGINFLEQITSELFEQYKTFRLKGELKIKKVKPITLNRQLNTLKPMFKKLVEWGYLESSPLAKVATLKYVEEEIGKRLTDDECQRLLEASKKCNCGSFYYLVATALGTGMRRNEIKNLMAVDVDLEKHEIYVKNRGQEARTKTGKNRVVDLSNNLVQILSKYKPHGKYMFDVTNFRRNWDKTKKTPTSNAVFTIFVIRLSPPVWKMAFNRFRLPIGSVTAISVL